MSRTVGARTTAPLFGVSSTTPTACSLRSASRTGVRLTPKSAAIVSWRSRAPDAISPRSTRAWSADAISSTRAAGAGTVATTSNLAHSWIHLTGTWIQSRFPAGAYVPVVASDSDRWKGDGMRASSVRLALVGLAAGALLALGAAAAGASGSHAQVREGGTLTIGLAEEPDALDPTVARTFVGRMVFLHMCE